MRFNTKLVNLTLFRYYIVPYHIKKFGYQTENIIFSLTNVEDKKNSSNAKRQSNGKIQ